MQQFFPTYTHRFLAAVMCKNSAEHRHTWGISLEGMQRKQFYLSPGAWGGPKAPLSHKIPVLWRHMEDGGPVTNPFLLGAYVSGSFAVSALGGLFFFFFMSLVILSYGTARRFSGRVKFMVNPYVDFAASNWWEISAPWAELALDGMRLGPHYLCGFCFSLPV